MATSVPQTRIAGSLRLILAMFRLYADIEANFGRAIINVLKKQYPGAQIDIQPGTIGHKMMNIARREVQNNDADAYDVIQKFLTYITTGSEFVEGPKGERVKRTEPSPFDFTKDSKTWEDALKNIYSNIRLRGIEVSKGKMGRAKKEKSVDQAYGTRPEGGGNPEGGEARMPTPGDTSLGKALDDQAAVKEFMDLMDEHVPQMRAKLPADQRALFDVVFEDNVGAFGSDIKENMGQATALKDKLEAGSDEEKEIYTKNAKRWSGFVGDLRKKLLDSIWDYIEKEMTPQEFRVLKDTFFSETTPQSVRKLEKDKAQGKADYQRGIDLRKLIRMREQEKAGTLSDKDKKSLDSLTKKLNLGDKDPAAELKKLGDSGKSGGAEEAQVASRLTAFRPWA